MPTPIDLTNGPDLYVDKAGDQSVRGLGGNDVFSGTAGGNDTFDGGAGIDTVELSFDLASGVIYHHDPVSAFAPSAHGNKTLLDIEQVRLTGSSGKDYLQGGAYSDTIAGGAGDDQITGSPGEDLLDGGDGWDSLRIIGLGAGSSYVDMTEGAVSTVPGGAFVTQGFEFLEFYGNTGDDTVIGAIASNYVFAGDGADRIFGQLGNDELHGDDGDDQLFGGRGADQLYGGFGSDRLAGGEDADFLVGDSGDDTLLGGGGADLLRGDDGADRLEGEDDADALTGGAGDDVLLGGAGADNLDGGADNDSLAGGAGGDTLQGRDGQDSLDGGGGGDLIDGGAGNDALWESGAGASTLRGGTGDDVLHAGSGSMVLDGGAGIDTVELHLADPSTPGAAVRYSFQGVSAVIDAQGAKQLASLEAGILWGGLGSDQIGGAAYADRLFGQAGDDTLSGGDGADLLDGGEGADSLDGGAGGDTVSGAEGDDRLFVSLAFGAGDDLLDGGAGSDTAVLTRYDPISYSFEAQADGSVRVTSTAYQSTAAVLRSVETIQFQGFSKSLAAVLADRAPVTGADSFTLAEDGQTANLWSTLLANDVDPDGDSFSIFSVTAGLGSITFDGFGQTLIYNADAAAFDYLIPGETLTDSFSYSVIDQLGHITTQTVSVTVTGLQNDGDPTRVGGVPYTGTAAADYLVGTAGANTINGAAGDDRIEGLDGADLLQGGAGNNYILAGAGDDFLGGDAVRQTSVFVGEDGRDTLVVTSPGDRVTVQLAGGDFHVHGGFMDGSAFGSIENLAAGVVSGPVSFYGDIRNNVLTGGRQDDYLFGDQSEDTLSGGAGADTLEGGFGHDTLRGGPGNDVFLFRPRQVGDTVVDFMGNGPAAGDTLRFEGFGPNFTLAYESDGAWRVTYRVIGGESGSYYVTESLVLNTSVLDPSDYIVT